MYGNNFKLAALTSYVLGGVVRYSADYNPATAGQYLRLDRTADAFWTENAQMTGLGYRLAVLDAYVRNGTTYYNAAYNPGTVGQHLALDLSYTGLLNDYGDQYATAKLSGLVVDKVEGLSRKKFAQQISKGLAPNVTGFAAMVSSSGGKAGSDEGSRRTSADAPMRFASVWSRTNLASVSKTVTAIATIAALGACAASLTRPSPRTYRGLVARPQRRNDHLPGAAQAPQRVPPRQRQLHRLERPQGDGRRRHQPERQVTRLRRQLHRRRSERLLPQPGLRAAARAAPLRQRLPGGRRRRPRPRHGQRLPGLRQRPGDQALRHSRRAAQAGRERAHPLLSVPAGSLHGTDWGDHSRLCGSTGLHLSADEVATLLVHVFEKETVLTAAQRETMRSDMLGLGGPSEVRHGTASNHNGYLFMPTANGNAEINSLPQLLGRRAARADRQLASAIR